MMKSVLLFLAIGQCCALAQETTWQHLPGPTGGTVSSLMQSRDGTIYAQAVSGKVFASTDHGDSWSLRGGLSQGIRCFTTTPSGVLYAGSDDNQDVYRSTDRGSSWSQSLHSLAIAVAAASDSVVYVAGYPAEITTSSASRTKRIVSSDYGFLYRTTDGGTTWSQFSLPVYPQSLTVDTSGEVFVGTYESGVYSSRDSGATWHPTSLGNCLVNGLTAAPDGRIYATVGDDSLFYSSDEGITWQEIGRWKAPIEAVAADSDGTVYASVSDTLYELNSANENWKPTSLIGPGVISLLTTPLGDILAGTNGDGIYRSSDGGSSWVRSNTGLTAVCVQSLAVTDSGNLLVGAQHGGLYLLPAGDTTWSVTNLNDDSVRSILKVSADTILAAAEHGIYRSTDGGRSWRQLAFEDIAVHSLAMDSLGTIFAGIDSVYHSTDGGTTWLVESSSRPATPVLSLFVNKDGNVFAGIFLGVFRSTDHGGTWQGVLSADASMDAFAELPDGKLFAAGSIDLIFYSLDDGATWDTLNVLPPWASVTCFAVYGGQEIFASDLYNGIYCSIDGGNSWRLTDNDGLATTDITALAVDGHGSLFAGTGGDGIYISKILTSVNQRPDRLPADFLLEQNYPNPFNPTTTIRFEVPPQRGPFGTSSEFVSLKVYDVLGRLVATLVDGQEVAGRHSVQFSGAHLASGVYFYRLTATGTDQVRKMILMK